MFDENLKKIAADQLGVGADYEIIVMSIEIEYLDDIDEMFDQFDGYVHPNDVKEAIDESMVRVKLPKGMVLVGMSPAGHDGRPTNWGIVNIQSSEIG